MIYWRNLPAEYSPSIPCNPTDNCVLHMASISALKVRLILLLCRSINTLRVCLKCASFIWHNEYRTAESSRLNCSATDELTSVLKVGQMLKLLNFSSGRFWFFWWNLSYKEYLSDVPVIGCLSVILSLFGCSSSCNGDLRFFNHCKSTCNSLLAARFIFSEVGAQSLPSCVLKKSWLVRLLVWRATCPATSEM